MTTLLNFKKRIFFFIKNIDYFKSSRKTTYDNTYKFAILINCNYHEEFQIENNKKHLNYQSLRENNYVMKKLLFFVFSLSKIN